MHGSLVDKPKEIWINVMNKTFTSIVDNLKKNNSCFLWLCWVYFGFYGKRFVSKEMPVNEIKNYNK